MLTNLENVLTDKFNIILPMQISTWWWCSVWLGCKIDNFWRIIGIDVFFSRCSTQQSDIIVNINLDVPPDGIMSAMHRRATP